MIPATESDAETHRTPKALRAKSPVRLFVSRSFGSAPASSRRFGVHHRFPTRLESVMFSMSVSVGRAKANATASATCVALIMRSRGHLPST